MLTRTSCYHLGGHLSPSNLIGSAAALRKPAILSHTFHSFKWHGTNQYGFANASSGHSVKHCQLAYAVIPVHLTPKPLPPKILPNQYRPHHSACCRCNDAPCCRHGRHQPPPAPPRPGLQCGPHPAPGVELSGGGTVPR